MDKKSGMSNSDDEYQDDGVEPASISIAPTLYLRPQKFRQTRKGKMIKEVSERYLRDDLGLGSYYVDDAAAASNRRVKEAAIGKPRTIKDTNHLLALLKPCKLNVVVVCDTNVLLHNLDVIEQSREVMPNLVFPQTSLLECRHNRMVAYDRACEILREVSSNNKKDSTKGDTSRFCIFFSDLHHSQTAYVEDTSEKTTINDENDARIRNVASFLGAHLRGSNFKVVLLTDDVGSRKKVQKDDPYEAYSVRDWVKKLEQHNPGCSLSDLVARTGGKEGGQQQQTNQKEYYSSHINQTNLSLGIKSGTYYRGVLRSKDAESGWVTIRRGEERVAITIDGLQDRNRAVDGDVVAIALHPINKWLGDSNGTSPTKKTEEPTPSSKKETGIASDTAEPTESELSNVPETITIDDELGSLRPTGKVVGILRRNFESVSGSIYFKRSPTTKDLASTSSMTATVSTKEKIAAEHEREHSDGTTTCVFFPVDKKIPPILIRTTQRDRFLGQRIVVTLDSWPNTSPYPLGHYVSLIGPVGSKDVETEVLLQEFKIPHEQFSAAVLACLPPNDYKITMVEGREDFRKLPVLSIDPPGCKDIDDALHCIRLPSGNFQVGVHIADVTHYVKAGSAMDLEAASRSTSTYLVNKRLDMLPALLTTDLCSLKGNVDR